MDEMRQVRRGLLIGGDGVVRNEVPQMERAYNTGSVRVNRPSDLFQAAPAFPEPALVDFSVPFVRNVSINPCLNGYIVNVGIGCQTVVFRHGQEEELGRELARYLVDPAGVEAEYRNAATNGAELRRGGA